MEWQVVTTIVVLISLIVTIVTIKLIKTTIVVTTCHSIKQVLPSQE